MPRQTKLPPKQLMMAFVRMRRDSMTTTTGERCGLLSLLQSPSGDQSELIGLLKGLLGSTDSNALGGKSRSALPLQSTRGAGKPRKVWAHLSGQGKWTPQHGMPSDVQSATNHVIRAKYL